jgi:hypothetical protein
LKKLKTGLLVFLSIVVLLITGFIREDVFVNINYLMYFRSNPSEPVVYPFHYIYKTFLLPQSYYFLYTLKWILTFAFTLLYWWLSYRIIALLTGKQYKRELGIAYLFLFSFSLVLMLIGYLINDYSATYKLSRQFMGIAQSPLPLMIAGAFAISGSNKNKITN